MTTIAWAEAVVEGQRIVADTDRNQMRFGQIADEIEPKYGESTLARYAQEIGANIHTLLNCRSVYRTWSEDQRAKGFPKFSVAKALVNHPDRAKIVEDRPNITEREAKDEAKKFREEQAQYAGYTDQAMHKLTKRIVTRLDTFLKKDGMLDGMLHDVVIRDSSDFEYVKKILEALARAHDRVFYALADMGIVKETYERSSKKDAESGATEPPDSDPVADRELIEDMGTIQECD